MTEKEFLKEVWRPYDVVLLTNGVKTRVLNVCFPSKSVKVKMPDDGMCEWFSCEFIESHKSINGCGTDNLSIIEELQKKNRNANKTIEELQLNNKRLREKLNDFSWKSIYKSVTEIREYLALSLRKSERIEHSLAFIEKIADVIEKEESD